MISDYIRRHATAICFVIGLLCVLVPVSLFVVCGDNYVVAPFDQLDSVLERYTLGIKHAGEGIAPEIMGGIPLKDLGGGQLIPRILFTVFPDSTAYALLVWFDMVVAYVGMFLLLREIDVRAALCLVSSAGFASLPFFALYGLSAMGIPFVAFGFVRVWKNPDWKNIAIAIASLVLFAACSNLVLSGYVICTALFAAGAVALLHGGRLRMVGACYIVAIPVLILLYVVFNPSLIASLGSANAGATTRSEMVLSAQPATVSAIWEFLTEGHYHVDACQRFIVYVSIMALVLFGVFAFLRSRGGGPTWDDELWLGCSSLARAVAALFALALFIALFYVVFRSESIVSLRNSLPGSLRTVQIDRFYWAYPAIWYVLFGLAGELLIRFAIPNLKGLELESRRGRAAVCLAGMWLIVLCCMGASLHGSLREHRVMGVNVKNIVAETVDVNFLRPERNTSDVLTWKRYFASDLFQQIKNDIGKSQEDYRVISVGLHPSVALNNGFYTLDGYRSYYPLDYKREFRKIISEELACDEGLRAYFDEWGSRCYAFSHEVKRSYLVSRKSQLVVEDLRFDLNQLKLMGGEYIISAVEIADCEQYGLRLVGTYESTDSYYRLRVYGVE